MRPSVSRVLLTAGTATLLALIPACSEQAPPAPAGPSLTSAEPAVLAPAGEIAAVQQADTLGSFSLQAIADDSDDGTWRFGGISNPLWVGRVGCSAVENRRSRYMNLLFDTSVLATLPACATVDSATLTVTQAVSGGLSGSREGSWSFNLRKIADGWAETADLGVCAGVTTGAGSLRGSLTGPSNNSGAIAPGALPFSFDVTGDVQDFRSSPGSNNGWSMSFTGFQFPNCAIDPVTALTFCSATTEGCGGNRRNIFSREDLTESNRPTLVINYTLRDSGCEDDNPCSENVCSAGGCTFPEDSNGVCSDASSCTTDTCVGTSCVSSPVNTSCNDGNLCTTDTCSPGSPGANGSTGCLFSNNAVPCNDGRSCTQSDTCGGGACSGTPNNTLCNDSNGCTNDTCNPGSGSANAAGCVFANNANACDDGELCTLPDTCSGGACVGTPVNSRCNDNNGCTNDTCNPASPSANANGCVIGNNTLSCNDNVACTLTDTCGGGACAGTPTDAQCNDSNECTTDVCGPGGCTNNDRPDGTGCTWDSNVCHRNTCQGGLCNSPNVGAACRAGSCSGAVPNAVAIAPAVCTAGGACPAVTNVPCGATTPCNAASTACQGACALDGDCPSGFFCSGSTCAPRRPQGGVCSRNQMCSNNRCVDGRCCDTACGNGNADDCQTCANAAGTCSPQTGTTCQDGNACTTSDTCSAGTCTGGAAPNCNDSNPCTTDSCVPATGCSNVAGGTGVQCRAAPGVCDLAEQCTGSSATCPANAFRPATFSCRTASCTAGQQTLAASCTGSSATCPAVVTQPCSPYVCGATACRTGCTTTAQCAANFYCNGSACVPQAPDGAACTAAGQCRSGFCTDGVCCDAACGGQCEACNVQGSGGECIAVTGVPVGSREACDGDGSVCSGSCNGTLRTACSYPASATRCRNASCTANVSTLVAQCSGTGACPAVRTQACAPFVCGPTQCFGTCTSDTQCQSGLFCQAGACVPLQDPGAACNRDSECAGGICADGVCCDTRCTGQCEACDLPESAGTCSAVSGQPRNGRPGCVGDDSTCKGVCGGARDACVYPGPGVECRPAECSGGTVTVASECQGTGVCPPAVRLTCPGDCVGTGCDDQCSTDLECGVGRFCLAGQCLLQRSIGEACSSPAECVSSFCVDGVCCVSGCRGQCEACNVAGSEGECAPVSGAPHGARPQCVTTDPECGGTCDGTGRSACAYPGVETVCEGATCTSGVATLQRTCASDGACGPLQEQLCTPFVCGPTACRGDCTSDASCSADEYCSGGICKPKLTFGSTCASANQCAAGFCVDRVCCNEACEGQCEACNSLASIGRCAPVAGQPHGSRAPCGGTAACAGQCDGSFTDACTFPRPSTSCGEAICSGGVARVAPRCNGDGTCIAGTATGCFPFTCLEGTTDCRADCTEDEHCVRGLVCTNGFCEGTPLPDAGTDAGADAGRDASPDGAPGTGGADAGTGGATSTGGRSGTGGTSSGPDSGAGDGGTDAGVVNAGSKDEGGCGCRVASERRSSMGALAGLAALVLLRARRRRAA